MPPKGYIRNPIKLTPTLVDEIMFRTAEGESLVKIVESAPKKFGSYFTLYIKLTTNDGLSKRFDQAREVGLQKKADELDDFASKPVKKGELDFIELSHRRLVIDTRKWLLSKQLPKRFGDKIDLNHGGQPNNPVIQKIERVIIDPKTPDAKN